MRLIKVEPPPFCPQCGGRMTLKRPKPDDAWQPFWGCVNFRADGCRGSREPEYKDDSGPDQLSFLPKPANEKWEPADA